MPVDPRTPVVAGVGQTSQRVPPPEAAAPVELFVRAARAAEADAEAALLRRVDVVAVVQIVSWRYPDPGALAARALGISPRATAVSTVGGNSPQVLVNELAARIARGELDVALIGGAEAMYTRWRARREPRHELTWESGDDAPCGWVIGDDRPGSSPYEMAHGAVAPTLVYPLFETALRAEAGRDVEAHQRHVSELWSRFAAVAAHNPHAWSRVPYTPEEIRTVGPDNRMVVFPYPKRMCANIDVDQGAAVILCSYEAARAAGVPDDRLVFLHAGAAAHDHWFVTERDSLTRSPAIAAVVTDALAAAHLTTDDVGLFDLYSCFPSAVQVAEREIGLGAGDERPRTVTGGLGFAGGPVNDYVTHSIAAMVERLRAEPGRVGVTTALGWYLTKHAAGVWSTRPPEHGFALASGTQARVDAAPRREPAGLVDGVLTVEATAVPFDRDGAPTGAVVALRTDDGRRALATVPDAGLAAALTEEAWEGRRVRVHNDGTVNRVEGPAS